MIYCILHLSLTEKKSQGFKGEKLVKNTVLVITSGCTEMIFIHLLELKVYPVEYSFHRMKRSRENTATQHNVP